MFHGDELSLPLVRHKGPVESYQLSHKPTEKWAPDHRY
jgi:hypothetical protein